MDKADRFERERLERIRLVGKISCRASLEMNCDRIPHFKRRMRARGFTPEQMVIVFLNADDAHGGPLAERLMPEEDWQQYRDQGLVPFARGLAGRAGIEPALRLFDEDAADKLRAMRGLSVVVVDHGVAEVFKA